MDFFEVVEKRHSYRGAFTAQPVPKEDIVKMLDAAIRAPSGLNYQPVNFAAVTDRGKLDALHALMPRAGMKTAPLVVVVASRVQKSPRKGISFEIEDYAAATENLLLAITALGYASVWIDGEVRDEGRAEAIAKLLGLPEGWTVRCVLPVGVPKTPGKQSTKMPLEERVWFVGEPT
ncbi:MAG: nitroreductase family protein [Oscillospiraceae bacterium]|jgi:nitroreductase